MMSMCWGALAGDTRQTRRGCLRMIYVLVAVMSVISLLIIGHAFDEGE